METGVASFHQELYCLSRRAIHMKLPRSTGIARLKTMRIASCTGQLLRRVKFIVTTPLASEIREASGSAVSVFGTSGPPSSIVPLELPGSQLPALPDWSRPMDRRLSGFARFFRYPRVFRYSRVLHLRRRDGTHRRRSPGRTLDANRDRPHKIRLLRGRQTGDDLDRARRGIVMLIRQFFVFSVL